MLSETKKSIYMREWYAKNRDKVNTTRREKYAKVTDLEGRRARSAARKELNKKQSVKVREAYRNLIDDLKDNPCVDCGNKFPVECMDFDHVRGEKLFSIGEANHRPLKDVIEEISKCELVCANCHRIRTRKRLLDKLKNKNLIIDRLEVVV